MKKIFGLLFTRNEGDLVESHLRYNLTFLDGMLVYENHRSYDNSRKIIENLINEGLPIYLIDDMADADEIDLLPIINEAAHKAVDTYGADVVMQIDTDEFLYHIDGVNPRETLELLREDVEYQALWRTYVYEQNPDIDRGFLPNNFSCYRNPEMESIKRYERHKKTIVSKYLLKEKQAAFIGGAHFLVFPEEHQNDVDIELHDKLVFAHFPIRSQLQVMKKTVTTWLDKWNTPTRLPRNILDATQRGIIFNELKVAGEFSHNKIKQCSIDYNMLADMDKHDNIIILSTEELNEFKSSLGEGLLVNGPMDVSWCAGRLELKYTDYNDDNKAFVKSVLNELDSTVSFLSSESYDRFNGINALAQQNNALAQQNNALTQQNNALTQQNNALTQQISDIFNSKTWKIGKKLQKMYRIIIRK